jgi:DNA-binding XRE family transcriptional regulator
MSKVQYIEIEGKRRFAVVPIELWARIADRAALEDAEDLAVLDEFRRNDTGERVPHSVVKRLLAGEHPVAAWRKQRGWSGAELARRAGLTRQMVSMIENRKRSGTVEVLRALSDALDASVASLLDA